MESMLSSDPEWRTFKEEGNAEDDSRVNTFANEYVHSDVLSTDFALNGKKVTFKYGSAAKRMENQKEVRRTRKLYSVHSLIQESSIQLELPEVTNKCAFDLYCKCIETMKIRGRSVEIIASSCLYLACRITNHYRLLSEIILVLYSDLRKVSKLAQVIISELKLIVPYPSKEDYIYRYIAVLQLPVEVGRLAVRVADAISASKCIQQGESAINAVAVMIASRILEAKRTPLIEQMASATSKSEALLLRVYKVFYTHCDTILVEVYKEERMSAKAILAIVQKLDPKTL